MQNLVFFDVTEIDNLTEYKIVYDLCTFFQVLRLQ